MSTSFHDVKWRTFVLLHHLSCQYSNYTGNVSFVLVCFQMHQQPVQTRKHQPKVTMSDWRHCLHCNANKVKTISVSWNQYAVVNKKLQLGVRGCKDDDTSVPTTLFYSSYQQQAQSMPKLCSTQPCWKHMPKLLIP